MSPVISMSYLGHCKALFHYHCSSVTTCILGEPKVQAARDLSATGTSAHAPKQKRTTKAAAVSGGGKPKKGSKGGSRKKKSDADPLAPKKPSNSFFWFCQEYRPGLQEHFKGEGVAGQHDLTKVLAKLWSETNAEDKKVHCMDLMQLTRFTNVTEKLYRYFSCLLAALCQAPPTSNDVILSVCRAKAKLTPF